MAESLTLVPAPKVVLPMAYDVPSTGVGGVALVLLTTRYLLGAGEAAVKLPESEVVVTELKTVAEASADGVVQGGNTGGVQVNVSPLVGKVTVETNVQLSVLAAPAVVAVQSVVVVLLL